jgi:non-ribosomal peptide synthetase component F
MVTHRSVAALTAWAQERFTDAQRDGMLASTSLSFDLSVFEILVTLALGGRIVLVENVLALSDPDLAHEIAFVNTVPSALSELLRAVQLPSSVHTVALAGEALPATLVERLYAHDTIDQVWNLYGPAAAGNTGVRGRPSPASCARGGGGRAAAGRHRPRARLSES